MLVYPMIHFADAADVALRKAATQNVIGAFSTEADQLFSDVLAVLRSTLGCETVGARLGDGRRLEQTAATEEAADTATPDALISRTLRRNQPMIGTVILEGSSSELSFMGAPLSDGSDAAIGCIFAIAPEGRVFTEADLGVVQQFARIASREFDLISATYTDPATGCMSQWAFDSLIEVSSCKGSSRGVVAIGVDGLDALVEEHGRARGEAVLQAVAQACRDTFRRTDLIARLGSSRLVTLLSEADGEITRQCAERLRLAIEQQQVSVLPDVRISASIGFTGPQSASLPSLVADAEKASYAAARMGGNRCVGVEDLRAALRVFKDRQG